MFGASKSGKAVAAGPEPTVSDAQIKYVTTLVNGDGTNGTQNNTFVDSSANNATITRVGNVTQGSQAPFGANWSNYFDGGASTQLSTPGNSTLAFGTSAYTMEAWVFITAYSANGSTIVDMGNATNAISLGILPTGAVQIGKYGIATVLASTAGDVPLNKWVHIAAVRTSTTTNGTTIYVNGILKSTGTDANTWTVVNTTTVGGINIAGWTTNGYISNVRIVKGTAAYTSNFTPSTAPLTAIAGTSLLTCQSPTFQDNSGTAATISTVGIPSVQRFSPFSNVVQTPLTYSTKFNGSSNILIPAGAFFSGAGTAATLEMWVYPTTLGYVLFRANGNGSSICLSTNSSGQYVVSNVFAADFLTSTIPITINTWHHVAVTRTAENLYTIYINGVSGGSVTYTGSLGSQASYIAYNTYNAGYSTLSVSNLRNVKGTALYTSNFTPPTSPLTAIANTSLLTCQDAIIRDNSASALVITATGSPTPKVFNPLGWTTSAAQTYNPAVYGGSMYFDGAGDYLSAPVSAIPQGTENFTIEFWLYKTSAWSAATMYLIGPSSSTNNALQWYINTGNSSIQVSAYGVTSIMTYSYATLAPNVWYHFALTRVGTLFTMYINGVSVVTATNAQSFATPTGTAIGGDGITGGSFAGYLSDIRVVKGTAVYKSNFVPPTAPLTAVTNTQLLLNGTSAGVYDSAMQTTFETVGNAQVSTTQKKFGTGSIYFDGTDDYIRTPKAIPIGGGDFTLEMWVYSLDAADRHMFTFGAGWSPADGVSMIQYGGNYAATCGTGYSTANAGQAIQINGWHHIAIVRNNTSVKFYYDGVMKSSGTDSSNLTTTLLNIGGADSVIWGSFYGYIDDFRITKGLARYTSNFTPPTAALPTS